eukprot:3461941-Amphidinium_carterae.1
MLVLTSFVMGVSLMNVFIAVRLAALIWDSSHMKAFLRTPPRLTMSVPLIALGAVGVSQKVRSEQQSY